MALTPTPPDESFLKKIFIHHLSRIYNGKCFLRKSLKDLEKLASFKGLELALEEFGEDAIKQIKRMETITRSSARNLSTMIATPLKVLLKISFAWTKNSTYRC